jgi:hypothetical protein
MARCRPGEREDEDTAEEGRVTLKGSHPGAVVGEDRRFARPDGSRFGLNRVKTS